MKNPVIILIIIIIQFFSCQQSNKNQSSDNDSKRKNLKQRTLKSERNINIEKITYSGDSPKITQLPFGNKISLNKLQGKSFYYNLIYKNFDQLIDDGRFTSETLKNIKVYKLPPIKDIRYIEIDRNDSCNCENGKSFESMLKLTKYRYRLPDISVYQCFYICNYDPLSQDFSSEIREYCQRFLYMSYGYLILYNPNSQNAYVITIFYDTYSDALSFRYFYVDKNYKIQLVDYGIDGEEMPNSEVIAKIHTVSISHKGEIKVEDGGKINLKL